MAVVPGVLLAVLLVPAGVGAGEGTAAASDVDAKPAETEHQASKRPARTTESTRTAPAAPNAGAAAPTRELRPAVLRISDNGAWADKKIKVLNAKKIYYGKADTATTPGVVKAKKVFEKIPEYQEIQRRGLTKDDIEYWTLMKKASKKFRAAVKKAAETEGKDLVAEQGAIEIKGETIPDMTDAVINALGS